MVDTCNAFYYVQKNQVCDNLARLNGISTKDLASWNTKVGSSCSGLWADTYACVGVIDAYDFQRGNMAGWNVVNGTFSAESKVMVAQNVNIGKAYVSAEMNDFVMAADMTLSTNNGNAGLIFRASSIGDGPDSYRGYYVGLSASDGGYVVLGRADNNWSKLGRASVSIQPGKSYRMYVEAMDDNIVISLDSRANTKITVKDGSFQSGSCGVRVYHTGASYRNIRIFSAVYDPFNVNMASNVESGKATLNTIFGDFTMDVDVQINGATGGNAGVIFRASNLQVSVNNYQGYYVGILPGLLMLRKADFGWTLLQSAAADISADNMHHIRILAFKDSLVVWVDDMTTLKIVVVDNSFTSGLVGARVWKTGATFDNFEIIHGPMP
ncbi:hypothetical protein VFPPC_14070 [Pochonia chlamydosporia 170]|uniref:LysM domain-containing protein n=1 Tax=Pochonia chlamydosporia 170 TaxID=1380566 RepID=A0A179F4Q7_METCM|nr:hypothetical protein VFPPC_14070 [Pochonia chlamydosporia 170]OAQ60418.1 hypothetical protein VFPPC_14070 [Pochonia chlamydosporia 170]